MREGEGIVSGSGTLGERGRAILAVCKNHQLTRIRRVSWWSDSNILALFRAKKNKAVGGV